MIKWILFFLPAIAIELMCYILAPLVALFVTRELRTDRVKRMGNAQHTLLRDYLIKPLRWFQTHDNAVDEWWYGKFNTDHWFKFAREWTEMDYASKAWVRYYCRVMWLWRNCAYGFHYHLFGQPREAWPGVLKHGIEGKGFWHQLQLYPSSFQFECHVPLGPRYISINIGWKPHKGFDRLMYANRIFSLRKYR